MAANIEIKPDAKLLVVDLAFIGDLIMSTPAYANLRKGFPEAQIDLLAAPGSRPVIENNGVFNRIFTTGIKTGGWKSIREESELMATECYDLVVSFHRGHGSLLMLKMAGVPHRIGFTNGGRSFFLTGGIPFQLYRHRAWNHLRLIDECLPIDVDYTIPTHIELDPDAVESIGSKLRDRVRGTPLIAINPNAAWPSKRWTVEGFAEIADKISAMGYLPVLIGSPKEKGISEGVVKHMKTVPLDLTGETSLKELAALLSMCALLITNDSGPMHMAHAVKTKVIAIFGPTDPERCGPWLGEIGPIQKELDCAKCYRKRCWHQDCMRKLDIGAVISQVEGCIN